MPGSTIQARIFEWENGSTKGVGKGRAVGWHLFCLLKTDRMSRRTFSVLDAAVVVLFVANANGLFDGLFESLEASTDQE